MSSEGISIDMLYVENADAIIVHVKKILIHEHNWIILIDGGKNDDDSNSIIKHLQTYTFKEAQKQKIDLIISTHPDRDHIGGLFKIVKFFGRENIGKIWIHDPTNHWKFYHNLIDKANRRIKNSTLLTLLDHQFDSESYELVVKGLIDGMDLINLIKEQRIRVEEPFKGLEFYDFLRILGPSQEFYESLVTEDTMEQFLNGLSIDAKVYGDKEKFDDVLEDMANPCPVVDENNETSSLNNSSVVFEINISGKRYLFTGDAGVQAFENIGLENLEKIYWLKVPHHGSRRNLTSGIIEAMQPQKSYVSAKGTKRHPRKALVNCLAKHGSYVYSTHRKETTLRYFTPDVMPDRHGWEKAEPIAKPHKNTYGL